MLRPTNEVTGCLSCPVGSVSALARGGRCPMVDRRRRAGTYLFVAGEPVETIWFVKHGAVVLSRATDDRHGEGIAWAVRRSGSFLGLEGLVRPTYLDSARAVTDVVVCGASRHDLLAWLRAQDGASRAVLDCVLLAQCADSPRRASMDGSAVQRVALWLLDGASRRRAQSVPRRVVAGLLGMQPETLSRALASLAAQGAIAVTRRNLDVVDAGALERAAGVSEARRSA